MATPDIEATLTVDADRSIIRVEGRFEDGTPAGPLVFLSDNAGIRLPNERIRNIKQNGPVWSYDVDASPVAMPAARAHVSWVTWNGGTLMLADLLPVVKHAVVEVTFKLPARWGLAAAETRRANDFRLWITSRANSVVYIGPDLRAIEDSERRLITSDTWHFSDDEAMGAIAEIGAAYKDIFGGSRPAQIGLTKALGPHSVWEAGTRGVNITIVSSDMPFKSQSLQRLHEQLRHEMFHLWIPEGVNLTGNYDWFYEGFALYQSLKLGVAVNRLRFEDYLDSLSQAIAIDRRVGGKISLIDAAKHRWSGDNNSVVYARGMLVAFLSDLATLDASKGKRSTDELVREVYQRHSREAAPRDGNAAVLELMRANKQLVPIVERYVTGTEKLDLSALLSAAGIESIDGTTLRTIAKPNSRQKKLLDKLGYNNWRKLSSTRK